eukprot:gnl/TRDRNA2_/TRDRNA2_74956_c0_seq2.p1 gnl/TRDRNA2_/TRDRNA2_74956_c0~~gnl/TRDRNA2_/TRDRNA2_74956_c0_seq2.p1  ORF type:complete len:103 (-),score=4.18 gnl/TRDRNA2_/TRDRNA2_74956_c0_seq2:227-535(-)
MENLSNSLLWEHGLMKDIAFTMCDCWTTASLLQNEQLAWNINHDCGNLPWQPKRGLGTSTSRQHNMAPRKECRMLAHCLCFFVFRSIRSPSLDGSRLHCNHI